VRAHLSADAACHGRMLGIARPQIRCLHALPSFETDVSPACCDCLGEVACIQQKHHHLRQNASLFFKFSLCLSRACLGKMTVFSIKWRKKGVFRTSPPVSGPAHTCRGIDVSTAGGGGGDGAAECGAATQRSVSTGVQLDCCMQRHITHE
jgi:hypothetical protein